VRRHHRRPRGRLARHHHAFGAVVGAALIEVIRNSLTLLGISTFWQGTFVGSFIVIAVLFDRLRARTANE
jgi:ribose transport system permease protein